MRRWFLSYTSQDLALTQALQVALKRKNPKAKIFFAPEGMRAGEADDEAGENDPLGDGRYLCGSIILAHQGCGYYDRLIITTRKAGQVWTDGRVSDQGIGPLGCDFCTCYDRWVTDAHYEL